MVSTPAWRTERPARVYEGGVFAELLVEEKPRS